MTHISVKLNQYLTESSSVFAQTDKHHRQTLLKTRNVFCGTWYLPHNQVCNDGTVPIWPDALCMR